MSTRSGKRIHSSISENVESGIEIQMERKTRSKRVKETGVEIATAKKKKNFVTRPCDDEIESSNDKTENNSKSACKTRRQTLRELNMTNVDSEALNNRKSMRQSRRIRKEESETEPINVSDKMKKEKKKNKKKKRMVIECSENDAVEVVIVSKKKTHKKKRKSSSFIVEELVTGEHNKSLNKSNISIDSFHSAAGSPGKNNDEAKNDEKFGNNKGRKTSSSYNCSEDIKDAKKISKKTGKDNNFEMSNMSVKLSASNKSFESSVNKMEEIEDKDGSKFEKEISVSLKTKSNNKKSKDPKFLKNKEYIQTKSDLTSVASDTDDMNLNSSMMAKSNEDIYKMKTSTSVDFINIPHVNGTNTTLEIISPLNNSAKKIRKSTSKYSTSNNIDTSMIKLNDCTNEISDSLITETVTITQTISSQKTRERSSKDATYEKINVSDTNLNQTFNKSNSVNKSFNADKKKSPRKRGSSRSESSIKNTTYDKIEENIIDMDTTFNKELSKNGNADIKFTAKKPVRQSKISLPQEELPTVLNSTYDKISKDDSTPICKNIYNKTKLDTTFERSNDGMEGDNMINSDPKSSIISSDNTDNVTSDMSRDGSRISITSDGSRTENIVNTTPLLIESSMDESQINSASILLNRTTTSQEKPATAENITQEKRSSLSENTKTPLKGEETVTETKIIPLKRDGTYTELLKTPSKSRTTATVEPRDSKLPKTPLKREDTFTKESPDASSSKPMAADRTPTRRQSMPSPGRTPFPSSRSGAKRRAALNVTHSIEKPHGRSSGAAAPPRPTRVMFRSPVDDPVAVAQTKGMVIKSSLKGSNRSFVFDESVSERSGGYRRRSRTHGAADDGRHSARTRTASAAARLQAPAPAAATPPASKPDAKLRTRLPDFAALHQKHFSKMESLDECQRRRARRARALLTPTATTTTTTTTATTRNALSTDTAQSQTAKRPETEQCKEIDKKNQSYTRFGFKLNPDVNPFSIPAKTADIKPKALKRQATLPSLAGTTLRKEVAKQAVMREKSFTDKRDVNRNQNRTVIKGVRTNRRFELQMKMRNIN